MELETWNSKPGIVCFGPDPWDGLWRNRQQIMTRLARRGYRILYVDPRPDLRRVVREVRAGRLGWRDFRADRLLHRGDGLFVYRTPLYAPLSGRTPLRQLFAGLRRHDLRRTMARLGIQRPILWLYRPFMDDTIGQCDERLVVYHVVDEYAAYEDDFRGRDPASQSHRQALVAREERLLRRADLVIVTSPVLQATKAAYNPNLHLVPNGVDFAAFTAALDPAVPVPAPLRALPRPVIGYVGAVNEKLDFALLRGVAEARPDWSLALVGPVDVRIDFAGLSLIQSVPNIHFFGRQPVADVPAWMKGCDVTLLPYRRNLWTENISPLKLYEYLAIGHPIVATNIPAVRDFAPVVRIAEGPEAFTAAIAAALAENDSAQVAERRRLAAANTWDERVARIDQLLQDSLRRIERTRFEHDC